MRQYELLRRVTKDINLLLQKEELTEEQLKPILANYFKEIF